jgi:hypothetical protein
MNFESAYLHVERCARNPHIGQLSTSSTFGKIVSITSTRSNGNSNRKFYEDKTGHSNVLKISHTLPMQGCLPSNALNDTKTNSTMCTKLAQVSQNWSLLMLARTALAFVNDF